ncbi:MAG: DNA recombination/repair protein RecA, partial [Oscillospiraceae bacterium]|nr:DNA recombination/repair protein RecA [Oscillospiraceae bacterium]
MLARLMSQAMRRLAGAISKNNCTVIFINQLRQKIGVMYGNPETTPGGLALKYYASVRIDVRRIETLKVGGEMVGNRTRAKVVKNKVAPPFREAEFDIMYGEGISRVGEIIDLGVKLEIIDKAGAWFTVDGQRIQGRDGVKEYLLKNEEVRDRIEQQIRDNAYKLMSPQARRAAEATGRVAPTAGAGIDVSAADFDAD